MASSRVLTLETLHAEGLVSVNPREMENIDALSQPRLDLRNVRHVRRLSEWVPPLKEEVPPRDGLAVVAGRSVVDGTDIDGEDGGGALLEHDGYLRGSIW